VHRIEAVAQQCQPPCGNARGRNGLYRQSAGLAIEPTAFPNAVNQSNFPPAILRPEQVYRQSTIYRFLTDETR
jgi:galactose mutarotase-like enzyme